MSTIVTLSCGFTRLSVVAAINISTLHSVVTWIMILRTYALYKQSKVVLGFLGFLWVLMVALMLLAAFYLSDRSDIPLFLVPILKSCLIGRSFNQPSSVYYAGILVVDTIIFGMTLMKTGKYRNRMTFHATGLELLRLYEQDGMVYYFVACLTHFFNFIFILAVPNPEKTVLARFSAFILILHLLAILTVSNSFSQTFATLLVCRLVLRLRKKAEMQGRHVKRTRTDSTQETSPGRNGGLFTSVVLDTFFDIREDSHQGGYTDTTEIYELELHDGHDESRRVYLASRTERSGAACESSAVC
ncbi:hypothetical protein M422DRAFT_775007 [Sphaerobolus stellatus SS14]|nr:hypothetical protein M422DRAFT_775007 [Sphaerobolus stellatus SS14]